MGILKENKAAIRFLLVFVGLYLVLNTLYGLFIEYYLPQADPVTWIVSKQVSFFLSFFDNSVTSSVIDGSKNILIRNSHRRVLLVFEGCNGINVMIVFTSFIISFRGPLRLTLWFGLAGLCIIYVMNFCRVSLLYAVEIHFPQYLYLVHKYLLTGIIYAVVFFMWYQWAKLVKRAAA